MRKFLLAQFYFNTFVQNFMETEKVRLKNEFRNKYIGIGV
jgi:hypothetical protein